MDGEILATLRDVKSLLGFESLDLVYLNGWAKRLAVEGRLEGLRRD